MDWRDYQKLPLQTIYLVQVERPNYLHPNIIDGTCKALAPGAGGITWFYTRAPGGLKPNIDPSPWD